MLNDFPKKRTYESFTIDRIVFLDEMSDVGDVNADLELAASDACNV
jgi:hypothetical protein